MRDAWYPVLLSKELPGGQPLPVKLFGDPLVLFRDESGQPACFLDACPHRFVPLSLGKVRRGRLACAYHGWQYNGAGRCVHLPLLPEGQSIPRTAVAHAYPCMEREGAVWIWPGDPRRAAASPLPLPTELPEGFELTNQLHKRIPSRYDYLIEHVLDLPHFFQVHAATLLRLYPASRKSLPEVVDVQESAEEMTVRFYYQIFSQRLPVTMKIFRPCHMRVDMALPGGRSFTALFFNTPTDETHTRGNMFVYRGFLTAPVLRQLSNWLLELTFYKAINEDMHLLSGQMENLAMKAKSTTGYFFDALLNRYHRWQRHADEQDLWFQGFEHARQRCAASPALESAAVPPEVEAAPAGPAPWGRPPAFGGSDR
ncbi:Rieske 2Fe-2S domain-containing protein [Hyalangium rubrum]|uniref:Rieske 2Fe-2S domain-containing protein n=1 Tax=Hyalangium rubrum TaxID=3103134 RepID=A0ABU5HHI4_9BACT|nr:Rieske 2Fe-2S domain-containing protein [Hyalangium sp. s54d21]MDY7232696.1 Rieske 2Fe-2S domain-containing protein [Hyalangium sp. s54d21]